MSPFLVKTLLQEPQGRLRRGRRRRKNGSYGGWRTITRYAR
jgi:hypothetical protein